MIEKKKGREYTMEDMKYCQSCGMPMGKAEDFGTEKGGVPSEEYCVYCRKDGAFTADCTMEQMIDFCVEHTPEMCQQMGGKEEARRRMLAWFPTLKRWKKA